MLKQLVILKRMSALKKELETIRTQEADFLLRKTALETREAELEVAVTEMTDEATDEEKSVVDESVLALETDNTALETEQTASNTESKRLEDEIRKLQVELDSIETKTKTAPEAPAERKVVRMDIRSKFFKTREERSEFIAREEIKDFLTRMRGLIGQKRAVSGAELGIPIVMLDLLRDNLNQYSKLISKISLRPVAGKARMNVMGAIPEGVWTEACAKLNELIVSFTQVEIDGYKVGGFIPICNATLEDSDENLAQEIMNGIGQAIGYAIDKAVLYGTGVKMPMGIATRLAQASAPSNWNTNSAAWTDLRTTNVLKFNPAGITAEAFFGLLITNLGVADISYASGGTFWAMNRKTKMALMAKMINFNAAGALVAGATGTMPVEGGDIVELPFIPDNDIIGGFGSLYLLAERAGAQMAQSEHVLFIDDQTVFKGTARYDGMPVFGEAFVQVNIANADPTASVAFPQDVANTVATPKTLPIAGTIAMPVSIAITCDTPGALIYYTVDGSAPTAAKTLYNGPVALIATTTIKAIAIKTGMTNSAVLTSIHTKA